MTKQDRSMELLRNIGEVKEQYIADADSKKKVRKFTMKKSMYAGMIAACLAVVVIAGGVVNHNRISQDENVQIPNPYIECKNLTDASEIAGFDMSAPDSYLDSVSTEIEAIEQDMIQIMYLDAEGNEIFRIRKATGTEDISGDYNTYEQELNEEYDGTTVTLKGNADTYSVVTWNNGDFTYAIDAQDNPVTKEQVIELINLVQ